MSRSVAEWIGKTPDAKIPPHVKLRIFRTHAGKCHLTGRKIRPGDAYDFDHIIALVNGGEHRESNLAPALRNEHRKKTAEDVKAKAKGDRAAMRHFGIDGERRSTMQGPGFRKSPKQQRASTPLAPKFEGDILATNMKERGI